MPASTKYIVPLRSIVTPVGPSSRTLIASFALDRRRAAGILPATVVMVPLLTIRIRLLPKSAMYRFPARSAATSGGSEMPAPVAGPPSPREDAGRADAGHRRDGAVAALRGGSVR